MYRKYHRLITQQALQDDIGSAALQIIVKANCYKDDLLSNLFNPEHHFTENTVEGSLAYIETQRNLVVSTLQSGDHIYQAWQAFGRLLHTAQDFYAHSNYVRLWIGRFDKLVPSADRIEAMEPSLLKNPELHTVRAYRPLGSLGNIPVMGRWLFRFLPADAHARMCLDSTANGPLFEYAFQAAVKRTTYEYRETEWAVKTGGAGEYLKSFFRQKHQVNTPGPITFMLQERARQRRSARLCTGSSASHAPTRRMLITVAVIECWRAEHRSAS